MTTETTTFDVAATPEQIKLGFREPASDVKVLVRDKDQTPYQNRSLERRGWKRASADEATYLCEVTEEEKRLEPGQAIVVTAEWTASGAAHRDEKIVTVVEETPDDPSAEQRQETVDDTRAELRQETVEETPDDPSAELRQETPDDTRAELRQETVEETLDDTWAEEPEANIEEYGLPTGDTNGDAGVVTPAAGSIDAFQTECGVMLYFPCQIEASELEIALAPDRASLRLQERGWKVRPVGTQAVECLPLTREAIGSGDLSLSVRYFCAGEPREEMLSVTLSNGAGYTAPGPAGVDQQAPSAHKPPTEAYAPATPGGAGPGGGSGPGGGGGGPGGIPGGGGPGGGGGGPGGGGGGPGGIPGGGGPGGGGGGPGGIPGGAAAFLGASAIGGGSIADIFKVPLRVRDGVVTGGGEDLAAWRDSVIENVFQTLPPRPAATQFRDSLAAAFGAFTPPSAYGPGVMPFAGPAPAWSAATGGASPGYVPPWIASQSTSGGGSGSPYGLTAASPPLSMGQLTGPFADLASIADALELNAVPAARDLTALTQNADLDEVEAERVLVQDALASLIDELRQPSPDGPQRSVALAYVQRLSTHVNLLGQTAEIVNSSGQFGTDAVTPLDFANVSRFRVLVQWATIAQVAVQQFAPNVVDAPAIVGRVKQLLGVVAEKSRELELEFDIADFGPLERSRFSVTPTTVGPLAAQGGPVPDPIIFARLLDWMQEQASRNLPRLLDTSGNRAGGTVRDTLATQAAYAEELVNLGTRSGVFPFTHPIIARIVGELLTYVSDAFTEAGHL